MILTPAMIRRAASATMMVGSLLLVREASAQASAATSTTASATVRTGIGIAATAAMNFGSLVSGTTGGTVALTSAGARSSTGSVVLATGAFSRGEFLVNETGPGTKKFWVQVPTSITITRAGGGATMTISAVTTNISTNCVSTTGAKPAGPQGGCPSASNFTLALGGTLNVGGNQAPGTYTGLYNVTVNRW